MEKYKVAIYVPVTHAEGLRQAIGEAGGGEMGNYSFCSFSTRGTGRYRPKEGAEPFVGKIGEISEVEEEKIEFICRKEHLDGVIKAMREAHPYEEMAYEVIRMENF